jgi:RNA polymerase sigma-70 factor (ECF subfamily)
MDHKELIKRCKKRDPEAQKTLYNLLSAPMYKVCLRYFDNEFDAEDTLISGLYKFFHNIDKFEYHNETKLFGWAKRIVVNEALMLIRSRTNFNMVSSDNAQQMSSDVSPLGDLQAQDLLKMIRELPLGYRTVFNLYVIEGYNHVEIGKMLEINTNTSKSQLHKAKAMLRRRINKNAQYYGT